MNTLQKQTVFDLKNLSYTDSHWVKRASLRSGTPHSSEVTAGVPVNPSAGLGPCCTAEVTVESTIFFSLGDWLFWRFTLFFLLRGRWWSCLWKFNPDHRNVWPGLGFPFLRLPLITPRSMGSHWIMDLAAPSCCKSYYIFEVFTWFCLHRLTECVCVLICAENHKQPRGILSHSSV